MARKERLILDEFMTARPKFSGSLQQQASGDDGPGQDTASGLNVEHGQDARKALRQVKRARLKGASFFVNVKLDRDTKRRLKLAAFNGDTSMQVIMEEAIRSYLDEHGF